MDTDQLKSLALQLAVVAERLDQRSEAAVQRVEQTGAALDQRAQWFGSSSGNFAHEVSQALQQQSGDIVSRGLAASMERFNAQVAAGAQAAADAAQALERERLALARERRTWIWLGSGALLAGSVLAVGSAAYAVSSSREQVERNRVEAGLLQAINRADVTLCGERLCANVEDAGTRFGERKQYRPVEPR